MVLLLLLAASFKFLIKRFCFFGKLTDTRSPKIKLQIGNGKMKADDENIEKTSSRRTLAFKNISK